MTLLGAVASPSVQARVTTAVVGAAFSATLAAYSVLEHAGLWSFTSFTDSVRVNVAVFGPSERIVN